MVTICQISEVDYSVYDEVWAIVRSLKYSNPRIKHVPELSPSWGLFKLYMQRRDSGSWNTDVFKSLYVPQFLKEMRGKEQQRLLNELFNTDKHICLVCFCKEEELCHRSIIGGMLQGAGLEVKGLHDDYSYYFDWWKNGVPGLTNNMEAKQQKRVADYNGNVRYLYRMNLEMELVFESDIPTLTFTGRRPKDLCGYDTAMYKGFVSDLAELVYTEFYVKRGVRRYLTGGAQGFDQMSFWAVERMRKMHAIEDIQNVVFVPFEGQESRWAEKGCFSQAEYWQMIRKADMVVVVSNVNEIAALFERNHMMCNEAAYCLGLFPDDSWTYSKGGTAECMRYAKDHCPELLRLGYDAEKTGLVIGELHVA